MAKRRETVVVDTGPAEMRNHNTVVAELDVHNRMRIRVVDQYDFDRLLHKRLITMDEHTSAEHLFRDLTNAGYIRGSQWNFDAGSGGDPQGISRSRSDALVRVGMARRWLHRAVGRKITDWLVGVCLGSVRVPEAHIPILKQALRAYREFETAWHNYDGPDDLPSLLGGIGSPITTVSP